MISNPVTYFQDNLIFTSEQSCWAVFELLGFDYDLLAEEGKMKIFQKLTAVLSNVATEAKIHIIPTMQDLDEIYAQIEDGLLPEDPLYEMAVYHAQETKTYLQWFAQEGGRATHYRTFLYLKLDKANDLNTIATVKQAFDFFLKSISSRINELFCTDTKDLRPSQIESYKKAMQKAYMEQVNRMALLIPNGDVTQWLLRHSMLRGLSHDMTLLRGSDGQPWKPRVEEVSLAGQRYLRPCTRQVTNLFDGVIQKDGRSLEIEHADGSVSHQTFLALTHIPETVKFPGGEWLYYAQRLDEQIETVVHVRNHEHQQALRILAKQRQTIKSDFSNIDETNEHEIPADLWESKEQLELLEQLLRAGKYPLSDISITFCLADTDPQRLNTKALHVLQEYRDLGCVIWRPLADQMDLFLHCCPGTGITVHDFVMRLPPPALAAGMIGATRLLGDMIGNFVGTTGIEGKAVYLDLRYACLNNMSACATFFGDLGYGKSFNANLLLYLHVLYGGYGLVIDPKGERGHWELELTALEGFITTVTLSSDAQFKGTLDPFNVFRGEIDQACELALTVLADKLHLDPRDDMYLALQEGLGRMRELDEKDTPSMLRLCEILASFPDDDFLQQVAQGLSRRIRNLEHSGLCRLLIGDGSERALSLENRLNILQVQNLSLPAPGTRREDFTDAEATSSAVMTVISAFCRKFAMSFPNKFKTILVDESWFMSQTQEGAKLISFISRMSRSLYCSLILNGHSVDDLPSEKVRNTITYKFCFHTDSQVEAAKMLEYLKLEKTQDNINILLSLENRQCLFQDRLGHVGVLTFDAVFQDLIDVFSTTPVDERQQRNLQGVVN